MATPSTLGSHEKASDARSRAGSWRRSRSAQARSSASSNALSRLIIGTRWRTSWNSPDGAAAHRVASASRACASSGWSASSCRSSHDEEVVLGVGDLRRVEHVVQLVVVGDQRAQLLGPRRRLGRDAAVLAAAAGSHGQAAMPAPTTASGSSAS